LKKSIYTLAIDPGVHAGWALFEGKKCIKADCIKGDDPKEVYQFLSANSIYNISTLVLEAQYMKFPKGFRTLCYRADIWAVLAEVLFSNLKVEWAVPSSWQAYYKVKGNKQAIVTNAELLYNKSKVLENMADAILIGNWYLNKESQQKGK